MVDQEGLRIFTIVPRSQLAAIPVIASPEPVADGGFMRATSAARSVEAALREAIITLQIRPGARLSEIEIAKRYEVSRQPVREALIALSRVGLVQVLPQRGTIVTKISTRQMMQVRLAREALEAAIVVRACERFDPLYRASLDAILDTQAAAIASDDHHALTASDTQFHAKLAQGADCEFLWTMVADIKTHVDRVRYLTLRHRESMEIVLTQHRAIVAAIDMRDPARAEAAMRIHLQEIVKDLPRVLASEAALFE